MAIRSIKLGAADFIEKPYDYAGLLAATRNTAAKLRPRQDESSRLAKLRARHASLSDRHRQMIELASKGLPNKKIAQRQGLSPRTVEIRTTNRRGARNLAERVRMEMELKAGR